jgi:hypothetical protein
MTRTEITRIERDDQGEPVSGLFVPAFAERFHATEGTCTACLCACAEHWEPLARDSKGWRGCTYALRQEVTRLRAELARLR